MKVCRIKRIAALLCVLCLSFSLFSCVDTPPHSTEAQSSADTSLSVGLSDVPPYSGDAYIAVNGNTPYFTESDRTTQAYESYGELDTLGRCTAVVACVGQELMPTDERGSIGSVKPSGWQTVKYDIVDGKYLYNRCHLIGWQLTGENANTKNLITGTRYLNIEGMLPFENLIADYVKETDNHVLYRVTPIFDGNDLVARGVLMEGWSVEDGGEGVCFCVYAYNVQPGVEINYADGTSTLSADGGSVTADKNTGAASYVLNTNTKKFHDPDCSSVDDIGNSNKKTVTQKREELISDGYSPCGICKP